MEVMFVTEKTIEPATKAHKLFNQFTTAKNKSTSLLLII